MASAEWIHKKAEHGCMLNTKKRGEREREGEERDMDHYYGKSIIMSHFFPTSFRNLYLWLFSKFYEFPIWMLFRVGNAKKYRHHIVYIMRIQNYIKRRKFRTWFYFLLLFTPSSAQWQRSVIYFTSYNEIHEERCKL